MCFSWRTRCERGPVSWAGAMASLRGVQAWGQCCLCSAGREMSTCCSWGARFGGVAADTLGPRGMDCFALHLFWRQIQRWIQISWYFRICQGVLLTPQSVVKQDIMNLLLCLNCYSDLKVNCFCCCCTACFKSSASVQELIGYAFFFKKIWLLLV